MSKIKAPEKHLRTSARAASVGRDVTALARVAVILGDAQAHRHWVAEMAWGSLED